MRRGEGIGEMRRFKKKAMSKEEIIEIKGYVRSMQDDERGLSETANMEHPCNPVHPSLKEKPQKSKT